MTEATRRGNLIRQQYAEFLQGYNWDYFLTSTFRQPRKEPYYALQSVWHELQKSFVARAFMVAEPHQSGDLHIHGLAAGAGPGWQPEMAYLGISGQVYSSDLGGQRLKPVTHKRQLPDIALNTCLNNNPGSAIITRFLVTNLPGKTVGT